MKSTLLDSDIFSEILKQKNENIEIGRASCRERV